jgi:hypothetical protein
MLARMGADNRGNLVHVSQQLRRNMITKEQITQAIPESLQPFLIVKVVTEIPDEYAKTVGGFFIALQHFACAVHNWRQTFIYFGESPFISESNLGHVHLTLFEPAVATCWHETVWIDVKRLSTHLFDIRVAVVIEELCHAFLNIRDESLIKKVVCHLYPRVRYENGWYRCDRNPEHDDSV